MIVVWACKRLCLQTNTIRSGFDNNSDSDPIISQHFFSTIPGTPEEDYDD